MKTCCRATLKSSCQQQLNHDTIQHMKTNLNFIFNAIEKEYLEYKQAVDSAETVIDAACIDYQI